MAKQTNTTHQDPVSNWFKTYFQGDSANLPPISEPTTPFQEKLRLGLTNIPSGQVRTYGELAKTLNTSPQGLGQALGANPFPILIPCHRVVATMGLGGFAYGSTWKEKLLDFET